MRSTVRLAVIGTFALATALTSSRPAVAEDVERVRACVQRNLPARNARQTLRLRAVDADGGASLQKAELFWRREGADARALLRLSAPPEVRGAAVLAVGDGARPELFLYLPTIGRSRKVDARGLSDSLFGTDFGGEDFARLQGLVRDERALSLPDAVEQGREVWVLETRPHSDSAYERVVSFVDKRRCVPLRVELYERGGRLRKVAKLPKERLVREGPGWVPTLVLMRDLATGSYTELIVDSIDLDAELPDSVFHMP